MRSVALVLVGLVVGLALGWGLAARSETPASAAAGLETAELRIAELEQEVERLERVASAKTRARAPAIAEAPADASEESETSEDEAAVAVASTEEATDSGPDAAERTRRVAELQAQIPVLQDRGDGAGLVETLKGLAALVPEGRAAAMELAVLINEDVSGPGELELSQFTFYTSLGDTAVRDLMVWSLENQGESIDDFRTIAVWSLPWVQPPADTIALYAEALRSELAPDVQRGMVYNLAGMKQDAADAVLTEVLVDPTRDATLRAQVATQLATTEDEAVLQALEQAAVSAVEPEVRDAASAALVARDPPATGYLVTGVLPEGQGLAAGMRAGDIVVSYGGTATPDQRALQRATGAASPDLPVEVVVVRGGREVTLTVGAGRLGVYGRGVEQRTDR